MRIVLHILCIVLLSVAVFAQQPSISNFDFSGGLNTKASEYLMKPNQSRTCLNWDLSEEPGKLRRRNGFVALTDAMVGNQPMLGAFGFTDRAGIKRLFGVIDTHHVDRSSGEWGDLNGLGILTISANFSYIVDPDSGATSLYDYVYAGETPFWAAWKNNVYVSNGRQPPLMWDNENNRVSELTVPPPGMPLIIPINDTSLTGNSPDGEYRYMTTCSSHAGGYDATASVYSYPVRAINEKILIDRIPRPTYDSTTDTTANEWDTVTVKLFRTRAYPEKITKTDTFFMVYSNTVVRSELDTLRWIDSIPDGSLNTDTILVFNKTKYGREADGTITGHACGSPGFIEKNKVAGPNAAPTDDSAIVVFYAVTLKDTLTGFESDTGRALYYYIAASDTTFQIGLPELPSNADHLIRILYKGYGYKKVRDTLAGNALVDIKVDTLRYFIPIGTRDEDGNIIQGDNSTGEIIRRRRIYHLDTVLSSLYQLAVFKDSSTVIFTDTLAWDTLALRPTYIAPSVPYNANYVTAFNDHLWLARGSNIWWSLLDTAGKWSVFNHLALNLDDGDQITAVVADRNYVKAYKGYSQFILYLNESTGKYEREWTVDGIGCVAPHSMKSYNNGRIYLSNVGVVYETGNIYKDKGSNFGIISQNIENLTDYPPDELWTAVGEIKDNKYWLSFPDKDTTYIYDFLIGAWTIYDYAFVQATKYDTSQTKPILPAKDMVFINSTDKVFKADTTYGDTGQAFYCEYESPPLAVSSFNNIIQQVAFGASISGPGGFYYYLKDAEEDTLATDTTTWTANSEHYRIFGVKNNNPSDCFYLNIRTTQATTAFEIDRIDIWTTKGCDIEKE